MSEESDNIRVHQGDSSLSFYNQYKFGKPQEKRHVFNKNDKTLYTTKLKSSLGLEYINLAKKFISELPDGV